MSFFDMISNAVKSYGASVIIRENELTVTNCQNGKTITIFADTFYDKEGSAQFSEYIVEFSTQHRHFEDDEEEEIIDYIQSIMRDEICRLNFSATVSDALAVSLTAKRITTPIRQNGCLITALTLHNMLPLYTKSTAGQGALIQADKIYPNKQAL